MAKAVIDETKRGKDTADVLIASTAPMLQMENLGILSPHNFDQSVLSKYKHYNDYWVSVLSIPTIQMYNSEVIDENDLPKEALDLTNGKWKNKLTTHDLTLGTFGAHWLTKIKDIFGEEGNKSSIKATNSIIIHSLPMIFNVYSNTKIIHLLQN